MTPTRTPRPAPAALRSSRQTKNWVVPVHQGAVKALKEAGAWTAEQEAHNNVLLKRQEVLAAAWADYNKANPPSDDKAFLDGWMKARAAALAKAGHAERLRIAVAALTPRRAARHVGMTCLAATPDSIAAASGRRRIVFDDPHAQLGNLQEAEVTRVRTLRGGLALGADRRDRRSPSCSASTSNSRCASSSATPSSTPNTSIC